MASSPDGTIYTSGCDHKTNSALYRVDEEDRLRYLGDARAASEAANNWKPGETAEKFHVPPIWYRDRIYIATADYSNQDDAYLTRRGFHWYGYDQGAQTFSDLSVAALGGVGAAHISLFAAAVDAPRGFIYGLGSPTSHLYQYDVAANRTTDLGRPPELVRTYYNPGRFLWTDAEGTVYFSVGTAGTLMPGEPATPKHVLSWSPEQGFGARTDWPIAEMLRTGQWSLDHKRLYVLDYQLNLYVFDDEANTFTKLSQGTLDEAHVSPRTKGIRVRAVQLSANERKIYFINDTAPANSLFEWDFRSGAAPRELARVEAIDPRLDARHTAFTGHDSWDRVGRFYVTGFGGEGVPETPNVYLIRVDPVVLKAAVGALPGVARVDLDRGDGTLALVRSGELSQPLEVILENTGSTPPTHLKVQLAAGATRTALDASAASSHAALRIVPDGDTYVVGDAPLPSH